MIVWSMPETGTGSESMVYRDEYSAFYVPVNGQGITEPPSSVYVGAIHLVGNIIENPQWSYLRIELGA